MWGTDVHTVCKCVSIECLPQRDSELTCTKPGPQSPVCGQPVSPALSAIA